MEINMNENGKMVREIESEEWFIQMEKYMNESGKITK